MLVWRDNLLYFLFNKLENYNRLLTDNKVYLHFL